MDPGPNYRSKNKVNSSSTNPDLWSKVDSRMQKSLLVSKRITVACNSRVCCVRPFLVRKQSTSSNTEHCKFALFSKRYISETMRVNLGFLLVVSIFHSAIRVRLDFRHFSICPACSNISPGWSGMIPGPSQTLYKIIKCMFLYMFICFVIHLCNTIAY